MGVNIQDKNAVFTNVIGSIIPFAEKLKGYWGFDTDDINIALTNKADGIKATLIGSPTLANGKLLADDKNGILTNITMQSDKTFIVITKVTGSSVVFGSTEYKTGQVGADFDSIGVISTNPFVQKNGTLTPRSLKTLPASPSFIAGAIGSATNSLFTITNKLVVTETASHTTSNIATAKLRICGTAPLGGGLGGSAEVFCALAYEGKLTPIQIQEVYNYLSNRFRYALA